MIIKKRISILLVVMAALGAIFLLGTGSKVSSNDAAVVSIYVVKQVKYGLNPYGFKIYYNKNDLIRMKKTFSYGDVPSKSKKYKFKYDINNNIISGVDYGSKFEAEFDKNNSE